LVCFSSYFFIFKENEPLVRGSFSKFYPALLLVIQNQQLITFLIKNPSIGRKDYLAKERGFIKSKLQN